MLESGSKGFTIHLDTVCIFCCFTSQSCFRISFSSLSLGVFAHQKFSKGLNSTWAYFNNLSLELT